ncbi:MAG: 50S ribosomal protein L5 [Candidatus Woesearchaeota archaeon]
MSEKMKEIRIEKVTLNVGAGKDENKLKRGIKLLKQIVGIDPVITYTNKRIPTWGLRPGLPIGCKITLRKDKAKDLLKRLLTAKDNKLIPKQFDASGNVSFGIHEYIDVPGTKYDPEIGIMGFEVCVTLERPGYRVKKRKIRQAKIHPKHRITKQDAISFMKQTFDTKIVEEEQE